ncbi:uracil DNA glycosylase superfamily protein [Ferrovum myxofaciens]|jgi:uracil-DNA glycosylase|uniref:Uracil DNA glycosylase superfamily protein n=1 Tax=Ferrovum myxofaciens TaxID=416213 RepID=A0A149VWI9_9PROT|nr:uracil-DNA glycosylase family protein [Ferrovum myxofaciens]KXW57546.1 uracil DNA glycosylase superfamily protein [Ferrovum myxofaciens]
MTSFSSLLAEARACNICEAHLPHGTRPVLQIYPQARVLIAGQAPGKRVHESGVPFDDASGDRLRDWMGVTREVFYNSKQIAILPMGLCFPGTGKSGDLPPRSECVRTWRDQLLDHLRHLEVTLVIGQYAQAYHMNVKRSSLTETVRDWRSYWPEIIPLPHPSPRNNIWLDRNPWFEKELIPMLRRRMSEVLKV